MTIRRVARDVNKAYFLDVVIKLHTVVSEPSAIETSELLTRKGNTDLIIRGTK